MLPLLILISASVYQFQDSFHYPDGSTGGPTWLAGSSFWEVRNEQFHCLRGSNWLTYTPELPYGDDLIIQATMTVHERFGETWAIAGIALRWDENNYWHLAFVQSPSTDGNKHFVELAEMKDGIWLAHSTPPTQLTVLRYTGSNFNWAFNASYRLKMKLDSSGIEGQVHDEKGTLCADFAYRFDNGAVTKGVLALDCRDFHASFEEVDYRVDHQVDPPPPMVFPTYPKSTGLFQEPPSGFFRSFQKDNRWWLIDPNGNSFYIVGTDHVKYDGHWCEALGYAPYGQNVQKKYGSEAAWGKQALINLSQWGFNTLTAGHSPSLRHQSLPHIEFLSMGYQFASMDNLCPQTWWTGFPNVFSDKWAAHCDILAHHVCGSMKEDPWLVGYFLDNELEWFGKSWEKWGLFLEVWKKEASHSGKVAWIDFLKNHYRDISKFNMDWGSSFSSWNELATDQNPHQPANDNAQETARLWVRLIAEKYFKETCEAIRRQDPNHLILGCRFAGDAPDIWDIAGAYCDVVSFNIYPRIDVKYGMPQGVIDQITGWAEKTHKPMFVTEWSFPALDTDRPSRHGAGMRVDTQQQRSDCFLFFQKAMFGLPFMVGSDYFMYMDEPALGISSSFPEDSNYGLVNEQDEPYPELTSRAAFLNPQVQTLHQLGTVSTFKHFILKPSLTTPPVLPMTAVNPFFQQTGNLRLTHQLAATAWKLDTIQGQILGDWRCLLHLVTTGNIWALSDHHEILSASENENMSAVDMLISWNSHLPTLGYETKWRFWIPKGNKGWFAGQILSVKNSGTIAWNLRGVFHYLLPQLGGSSEGDEEILKGVPNYYQQGSAWVDRTVNLGLGCWYVNHGDFTCNYWKDENGGFHADLNHSVSQWLPPNQQTEIKGPLGFYFGLEGSGTADFNKKIEELRADVLMEGGQEKALFQTF